MDDEPRCSPEDGLPHRRGDAPSPSAIDADVAAPMAVAIDQIQPYDRNPRQQPNRAYELIKASIEARGFRGVLPVTRRPGETHYRVAEGGNTTLAILKALHQGGDQRFGTVPCRFEPWVSESDTLIAHLVENDARDDLLFIDKAQAVREMRHLLEADLGRALSQRALAKALTERGYRLDHSTIVRMDYALDVLLPVIPKALRAGLGRPQVERLRRFHQALERLWQTHGSGDERGFETLFREALARVDSPQWAFKEVWREVEALFAEHTGHAKALIRAELEALLSKGAPPPSEGMAPEVQRTLTRSPGVATELDLERAASVETPWRVTEDVEGPEGLSVPVPNRAHPRPGRSIDAAPEACASRGDTVTTPQDPVLESVDRNTWAVLKISTHGHKAVAFPSYEQLCRTGNIGSRATLARSLAILRLTRWITLHRRVRDAKGRWRGNVYILHDEPLPLADTLHLDPEYMGFLREATTHRHRRVQTVAREVQLTIEEDIGAGWNVTAPEPALERRAAAVQALDEFRTGNTAEGTRRYFSLTKESLFRLYLARRQGASNAPASSTPAPVQNLHSVSVPGASEAPRSESGPGLQPLESVSSSNFELPYCSSNNNYTTTTTTDGADAELPLAFPEALSSNECQLASLYLRRVPEVRRQAVLDALAHRLKAIARGAPLLVYGAVPYLKALCERARNGGRRCAGRIAGHIAQHAAGA